MRLNIGAFLAKRAELTPGRIGVVYRDAQLASRRFIFRLRITHLAGPGKKNNRKVPKGCQNGFL